MAKFYANDKANGINTLSVAALTAAEKLQEGEIDRFKGCSQRLMSVSVTPIPHPPQPTWVPNVRGDRAFVRLVADMILQAQSEVQHAY